MTDGEVHVGIIADPDAKPSDEALEGCSCGHAAAEIA
jgi:hypothetical protein